MENTEGSEASKGKVRQVCRQWLQHEDYGLAYKLQNEEFKEHFGQNKKT